MSAIAPQTDIYLLKVPLEIDNNNQLTFADATAQYNYFSSLPKLFIGDNNTYQRKDGVIRVGEKYDDIITYNYVMYRNEAFSNKWFYAYITGMEFINTDVTNVSIQTDVFQTWQFDLTYKPSFIEREHVNDDTPGLHTVPESLETGEYEIVDLRDSPMWSSQTPGINDFWVVFVATKIPPSTRNLQSNGFINHSDGYLGGVFNTLHMFAVPMLEAYKVIKAYEEDDDLTSEAIINAYMCPEVCVNNNDYNDYSFFEKDGQVYITFYPLYNTKIIDENYYLVSPTVLAEDYHPVNNKLLTYPFSYFFITNKSGETVEFKYEDFPYETRENDTGHMIDYYKAIVPSTSISAKLVLKNYKSYRSQETSGTQLFSYSISYGKIPVCAWTTDYYTNWLTQNGVNVAIGAATGVASSAVSGGIGIATGIAEGNPIKVVGGAASGAVGATSSILGAIGQKIAASKVPPQSHGDINTGDFQFAFQRTSISFYFMSVRPEYAKIIDDYFSMKGYQVNSVKIPNITGRRNWNYVKTVGCYIEANIPQDDLQEIKSLFDKGITLWHNPATFADYTQANDII